MIKPCAVPKAWSSFASNQIYPGAVSFSYSLSLYPTSKPSIRNRFSIDHQRAIPALRKCFVLIQADRCRTWVGLLLEYWPGSRTSLNTEIANLLHHFRDFSPRCELRSMISFWIGIPAVCKENVPKNSHSLGILGTCDGLRLTGP